ncbi:hypothetical protein MITSMUL_03570 [Mitsuokella multacida DSM 20544]|uniref:Uncharacterized protein n=1 Tax=Mitsuokella multacida DSM 20544 TaxID=500635 RepID=C9KK71_9FIRM|nr:hypothetical protein MITSMUL_03570 [Mitsuokella multacida DSM 20544]
MSALAGISHFGTKVFQYSTKVLQYGTSIYGILTMHGIMIKLCMKDRRA